MSDDEKTERLIFACAHKCWRLHPEIPFNAVVDIVAAAVVDTQLVEDAAMSVEEFERALHRPTLRAGFDPDGYHEYGPWSRPYRALGPGNEHQTWHERKCVLGDGCLAREWEILDLDPPVEPLSDDDWLDTIQGQGTPDDGTDWLAILPALIVIGVGIVVAVGCFFALLYLGVGSS